MKELEPLEELRRRVDLAVRTLDFLLRLEDYPTEADLFEVKACLNGERP